MSSLPEGITQEDLVKYAKIDAAIKKLEPEKTRISGLIKKAFTKPGTFVHGNVVIERTTANLKDAKKFEEEWPSDQFPHFYDFKPTVNWKAVEADQINMAPFIKPSEKLSIKTTDTF